MKRLVGCICALCFICVPLNVRAMEVIPVSSFGGFDWAEYYFDENGNDVSGIPSSPGKYSACDESFDNCVDFELTKTRDVVEVSVINPTCYYDESDYVPILDVAREYPLLSVSIDSSGKFVLRGMSNYPNVDFVLKDDSLLYKKRVIDLYHEDVVVPYSSNGIYLEGTLYRDVGEYDIKVSHDYNLDHYEIGNDSYKLKIIEVEQDKLEVSDNKGSEISKKEENKELKKKTESIQTGVSSNKILYISMMFICGIGIVVLKSVV